MKGQHLQFYEDCMKTGELPRGDSANGLCNCIEIDGNILQYMVPTTDEKDELYYAGFDRAYWGSGRRRFGDASGIHKQFTPLRQTIVLFMAAINGEL